MTNMRRCVFEGCEILIERNVTDHTGRRQMTPRTKEHMHLCHDDEHSKQEMLRWIDKKIGELLGGRA